MRSARRWNSAGLICNAIAFAGAVIDADFWRGAFFLLLFFVLLVGRSALR